jgi:hypothetical protein
MSGAGRGDRGATAMTIGIGANGAVRRTSIAWLLVGLAMMLLPSQALARDPCTDSYITIPNCELQVQQPVQYKGWHSSNMNYYCTGDHPYYWGLEQSFIRSFTFDNSCFTATENIWGDDVNKLEVLITNWCLNTQDITLTLACSATPQPGTAFCATEGGPVSDPGCPQGTVKNICSRGVVPVCIQLYKETCANKVSYQCQTTFGITACLQCVPDGNVRSNASKIRAIPSLGPAVESSAQR